MRTIVVPVFVHVVVEDSKSFYDCFGVPHNNETLEKLCGVATASNGILREVDIDSARGLMSFTLHTDDGEHVPFVEVLPQPMLEEKCAASGGQTSLQCNLSISVPSTEEVRSLAKRLSLSYPKNPAGF